MILGLFLCATTGCDKARLARHLSKADKYFAAGQYSMAEIEYLICLRSAPNDAHSFGRLGTIYYEQGRLGHAFPYLAKACELTPNDLDMRYKLGSVFLSRGDAKEAREIGSAILEKMPGHPDAPLLLADSVASTNEAEIVRHQLEQISVKGGDTAALETAIGTLAFRQGNLETANVAFKRAQSLDPKYAAAAYALGNLHWAQNDLKAADEALKTAAELSPSRSFRRVRYAEFKLKIGERDASKQLLTAITKATPDYLPAWIRQVELALAEPNYTNCASLLSRALSQDPANYDLLLLRGRLMLAQGNASKAIAEFDRMSAVYTNAPQVSYLLALAHLFNNDAPKALKSLNQAITLNPRYDDAILLLAQLDIARGDTVSAITMVTDLLKRQPRLPKAHLELASAYEAKRDFESALATYGRLGGLYPQNPETPFRMGLIYLQQNRKAEARSAFIKTLVLATNYLPAVEQLVYLDLSDHQYTTALGRAEGSAEKNPKAAVPHLLEAKVHIAEVEEVVAQKMKKRENGSEINPSMLLTNLPEAISELDQAEAALLQAIELNPALQEPYILLAGLYVNTRKSEKAITKLNEGLAKNPRDLKALMLLATIQNEAKDFPGARATYEKLLAVDPDFYSALNNLAYLYSEKFNLPDKGYELASHARDLLSYKPQGGQDAASSGSRNATEFLKAYSTDTLGWIVFRKGLYPWALSLLQESAGKLVNEPEVQYHLGMAYYMLGDEDRAQTALKRSLSFNKDFPGRDDLERRLAILTLEPKSASPAALAELEKKVKDEPGDPIVLARLAAVYERDGNPEKIIPLYEAALKENSGKVPVLVNLARLYSKPGPLHNAKRALELAKDAYKLAPDEADTACTLARLVFANGEHKWALSLLQQGVAKQNQPPDVLYDFAMAYYSVGRVSDAETTMRGALQSGGSFSRAQDANRFLDLVPLAANPAKALASEAKVRETLKANADDVPALMAAALCSEQRDDTRAASEAYERVLRSFQDFTPAQKRLAVLCLESGDYERAYELAMKVREALPDDVEGARTLGIACYRRGDFVGAARLLNEAVQKGGENGTTMAYLGMAHFQLKNKESKPQLQRALALKIEPKLVEEVKQALAKLN